MNVDAKKPLAELAEEVNVFFRKGAHDILNLLQMVRLLLADHDSDKEQAMRLLEELEAQYKGKIDQLRSSFDEFRFIRTHFTPATKVNVGAVITTVLDEMGSALAGDVVVESALASEAALVYSEEHVKSAVRALVDNAVRYAKADVPLTLRITAEPVDEGVQITVQDNGIGIDMSRYRDQSFQPFTRYTTQSEGQGISLYLVKTMAERNGGSIELTSQLGHGTTVNLYLVSQSAEHGG